MTMRKCWSPARRNKAVCLCIVTLMMSGGCIKLAALWTNMTGGDIVKAEFKPASGPLLIFIDDSRSQITEPRAERDLHKKISAVFLENDVNKKVIPYQELAHFRQMEKDFDKLSPRYIGEKLGADQVIYINVERFTIQSEPGAPIFKGDFAVRVKVLSTERKHDVRLWPREESGRLVAVTTPAIPSDSEKSATEYAGKLADKLGEKVAKLFYEHRELDE